MLRCPAGHEESFLVLVAGAIEERRVRSGTLGCPACHAEYPIEEFVARFGAASPDAALAPPYDAAALIAFMGLEGSGGYVLLAGLAARHAAALVALAPGVHVVAVNPPAGVEPAPMISVLHTGDSLPLKSRHMRAVALGADHAGDTWCGEAVRVLLPGLRLVIEAERAAPQGAAELARGGGIVVATRNN